MKTKKRMAVLGVLAMSGLIAFSAVVPTAAVAQSKKAHDNRQKNKNLWRNLGIGAAAVAGHGLLKGNKTETVLGAAGAAYSANRYEQDRHSQSTSKHKRDVRYHRQVGNFTRSGKKYYIYNGHEYVMDLKTGARHEVH